MPDDDSLDLRSVTVEMQTALSDCLQILAQQKLELNNQLIVPFQFQNCMIFLSGTQSTIKVDVALSAPVKMDYQIKSSHLNTRYFTQKMLEAAIAVYGSDLSQEFAMSFLFRDGCGLLKSEQENGRDISLIERLPIMLDYPIQFAVPRGVR